METIESLQTVNATLSNSLEDLKSKAETINKECQDAFSKYVRDFIINVFAPAANMLPENIYLNVTDTHLYFDVNQTDRWYNADYIYRNSDWNSYPAKVYTYEMNIGGFSNLKHTQVESLEYNTLRLNLINFILQQFKNKTELFNDLIALHKVQDEIMQPTQIAWSEYHAIRYTIEANEIKIENLKVDEYLKIGKTYEVKQECLWLNEKDRIFVSSYKINKITAKKIFFIQYYVSDSGKIYEQDYQTTISNFREYIRDVIKAANKKAKELEHT